MLNSSIDDSVDYLLLGADSEGSYERKWRSEFIRSVIPQDLKDLGKKYLR
ncbi:MAG: hypothetical protein J07AB43_08140 [Candidatus Nanosalina sp. J07AB43]|nr:MAG: hypothetical protein J07AB43_08140 [Candidatus Nanosalina sp. J07AB43]